MEVSQEEKDEVGEWKVVISEDKAMASERRVVVDAETVRGEDKSKVRRGRRRTRRRRGFICGSEGDRRWLEEDGGDI